MGYFLFDNAYQTIQKIPRVQNLFDVQISRISFGYDNCLALSQQSNLYSWGSNNYGKLGHGLKDLIFLPFPMAIKGFKKIRKFKCGTNHSVILD